MKVEKSFYSLTKGKMYIAIIEGEVENGDSASWNLRIVDENNGDYKLLYEADFDGLYAAQQAMKKWRKGMKWNGIKG